MHLRGLAPLSNRVAGHQEAQMRKAVSVVVVSAMVGIFLDALLGPDETIAQRDMTTEIGMPFYGLHVALPPDMTNFPAEIVPLP